MKKYYKLLSLLPLALNLTGGLIAQNSEDEAVFDLSPFVVDESTDIGYSATSTLAGTRLNSNLRDIGASISIVNKEFLEDTASTNIADVLLFTPNTEVSGPAGNFSGYQGNAGSPIPEQELDRQQGGTTRIRGLASADLTRDYWISDVPFDTFNVDRIAVQRGANSALFGIGSPGGMVNHTTVKANLLGDTGRVRFETDQHGTARGSFRYNRVLVEDKLSIFVAGLWQDRKYEQEEAFGEDERIYLSALYKINENLRVNASYESGKRHSSNPDQTPLNDAISPWIEMGKPIVDNPAQGATMWRGVGDYAPGAANRWFFGEAPEGASIGLVNYYGLNKAEPDYALPVRILANTDFPGGGGNNDSELWVLAPKVREETIRRTGFHPNGAPVEAGTGGFYVGGFLGTQLLDRSIFDYRKHLYHGGAYQQNADWDIFQASIEGTWWDNKVGFEAAYYDQTFAMSSQNPLQGKQARSIYIDANRTLVNTDNGQPDGNWIPNPNFGKPVIGAIWQGNDNETDRDSTRITGFVDLHAEDFFESNLITRILGHLKLTGLIQERESLIQQHFGRDTIDPQTIVNALSDGDLSVGNGVFHRVTLRSSSLFALPVGNDMDFLSINSLSDLSGVNIGPVPFGNQRNRSPKSASYTGWNRNTQSFVDFTSASHNLQDNGGFPATFFGSRALATLDSEVLVGQHFLWDGALVLTGTWRNDVSKSASINAPNNSGVLASDSDDVLDPDYLAGPKSSDLTTSADQDTTSWGATLHTRELLGDNFLPQGTNVSFYYSESDNFRPTPGRVTIDNAAVAPTTGATEEMGIILELMEGKFHLRYNDYATGVLNNSFDGGGVSANDGILRGLVEQTLNPINIYNGYTIADAQAVLPSQGVLDLNDFNPNWAAGTVDTNRDSSDTGTQDFTSEGSELELAYNPSSNWTILVGVAKQETVKSNTYPVLLPYMRDFVQPNWVESSFAQNYIINTGGETLAERAQNSIVNPVLRAITQDGIPAIEQRKWRYTVNTSYHFGRNNDMIPDWLGDFTAGGGYRWQDKLGIGFGVFTDQTGGKALDPNKPFWGPKQDFVDLFFRSRYHLSDKYDLSVQLNIKDLFDNDDLVPIFANPDSTKVYRFLPGRLITLSGTLEF
jgi:hypothetical protein